MLIFLILKIILLWLIESVFGILKILALKEEWCRLINTLFIKLYIHKMDARKALWIATFAEKTENLRTQINFWFTTLMNIKIWVSVIKKLKVEEKIIISYFYFNKVNIRLRFKVKFEVGIHFILTDLLRLSKYIEYWKEIWISLKLRKGTLWL